MLQLVEYTRGKSYSQVMTISCTVHVCGDWDSGRVIRGMDGSWENILDVIVPALDMGRAREMVCGFINMHKSLVFDNARAGSRVVWLHVVLGVLGEHYM